LTAGLYLFVLIGTIPGGKILFSNSPGWARDGIAAASPFWGVGFSSALFGGAAGQGHEIEKQAAWLVFWIVAYGLISVGLLLATLKTFNRCLGRIDDSSPGQRSFSADFHGREINQSFLVSHPGFLEDLLLRTARRLIIFSARSGQ